jgi:protein SCO1/2
MNRRELIRLAGAGTVAATTGCLGALGGGGNENTVLSPPENYELLRDAELPYPVYGESLPEATVEAPLRDTEVSTREFVGERHVLLTFIFTRCVGVCPGLTANLVQVQAEAAERGYTDDVALLAVTFDPVYDTEEVLREYADDMGIDRDAGNFYLLRPDGEERAREVIEDTFGHGYEKTELYEPTGELEHNHGGEGNRSGGGAGGGNGDQEGDEPQQPFAHQPLFLVANSDGYVERSYGNSAPTPNTVIEDVNELVDA